jgi:hypothetical protein
MQVKERRCIKYYNYVYGLFNEAVSSSDYISRVGNLFITAGRIGKSYLCEGRRRNQYVVESKQNYFYDLKSKAGIHLKTDNSCIPP